MISFKGRHFPKHVILMAVRWYVAYPLSYRNVEELMAERNVKLDHSVVQKWVVHYGPLLESEFSKKKKTTGTSWRMDETYVKVAGKWVYLYRAVDKEGKTVDFMLSEKRDRKSVLKFFNKAIGSGQDHECAIIMHLTNKPFKINDEYDQIATFLKIQKLLYEFLNISFFSDKRSAAKMQSRT